MKQVKKATKKTKSRPKTTDFEANDNTCYQMLSNDFTENQKKTVYVSAYVSECVSEDVSEYVSEDVSECVSGCVERDVYDRVVGEENSIQNSTPLAEKSIPPLNTEKEAARQKQLLDILIKYYAIIVDCDTKLTNKQLENVCNEYFRSPNYLQCKEKCKSLQWIQENYNDINNGKFAQMK